MKIKPILNASLGLQGASLLIKSSKLINTKKPPKLIKKIPEIMIGTALLSPSAKIVNELI